MSKPELATMSGKGKAVAALNKRRAQRPKPIDNSSLHAGAPMYYYCISCGSIADTLPECHLSAPRRLCRECQAMKDLGWLE